MDLTEEFTALIAALQEAGVEFAVCGGLALGLHGIPRFTKDIDLLVLSEDLSHIRSLAEKCGFVAEEGVIPLCRQAGHPIEIHRLTKMKGEDHLLLDLLPVAPVLEDVWAGRVQFAWQGRTLPLVSAGGLAKMKRLAGRLQDLADIEALGFSADDPAIQP